MGGGAPPTGADASTNAASGVSVEPELEGLANRTGSPVLSGVYLVIGAQEPFKAPPPILSDRVPDLQGSPFPLVDADRNFATLDFSGPREDRVLTITLRATDGSVVWTREIRANELR